MFSRIILFFFLLIVPNVISAQWIPDKLLPSRTLAEKDSNRLVIDYDAIGFFKNNEYFSPISEGATFPGIKFRPRISYQIDNKLKAELGVIGLLYSGDQQKSKTSFFQNVHARLQYAIDPNFNLVFGNYYDGISHRLIEPIYRWEQHLINKPESGLQMIYENEKFFADIWINWQQYIEKGDTVPEVLTFGLSSSAILTKPTSRLQVSIPIQLLINHRGGQIDNSNEKMVVAGNFVSGISTKLKMSDQFFKTVGLDIYGVGYYDKLPDSELRPYNRGMGLYTTLNIDADPFSFMAGYWYAHKFYSFGGEPLFASFNTEYPGKVTPNRKLITTKFTYSKQLHKAFSLGAHLETYTDFNRGETDYSFSVYLRLNSRLLSKHISLPK